MKACKAHDSGNRMESGSCENASFDAGFSLNSFRYVRNKTARVYNKYSVTFEINAHFFVVFLLHGHLPVELANPSLCVDQLVFGFLQARVALFELLV